MRAKRDIGRAAICLAQASFLLFSNVGIASAAVAKFTSAETTRIEGFENKVFGSVKSGLSDESRLRALETNLFGDVKKGKTDNRLDAVDKALKIDRSAYLMPPLAGQLDHAPVQAAPDAVAPTYSDPPKSVAADLLQEAMDQYSAGNTSAAEQTFRKVIAVDKNNVDAYFNLGVLYEGKGDIDKALDNYTKAQSLNPADRELRETVNSLRTKVAQAQQQKADEQKRTQLADQSRQRDSLKQLVSDASSDYKSGRFSDAVKKLERVSNQAPSDPDVQYALGQAYRAKGEAEKARTAFSRAMSIDPVSPLYKNALSDLNSTVASNAFRDSQADPTPVGEIKPFSGGSGGGPGLLSRGIYDGGGISATSSFGGTRLKRALAGGAVGAAAGALFGATTRGGLKSSAMRGALLGGMLGYFSGP